MSTDERLIDLEISVAEVKAELRMCGNMLRAAVLMVGAMLGIDVSVYM